MSDKIITTTTSKKISIPYQMLLDTFKIKGNCKRMRFSQLTNTLDIEIDLKDGETK